MDELKKHSVNFFRRRSEVVCRGQWAAMLLNDIAGEARAAVWATLRAKNYSVEYNMRIFYIGCAGELLAACYLKKRTDVSCRLFPAKT